MPAHADVYQAIADPTRRQILDLLAAGERSVTALASPFAVSRPAISQHLRVLQAAGLVADRRQGRLRLYRLQPQGLAEVARWLDFYQHFWHEHLTALADQLTAYEEQDR